MSSLMKTLKRILIFLVVVLICASALWFIRDNYGYVFSQDVEGEVIQVSRITNPTAILGSSTTPEMLHSYTVLIRSVSGNLFTASSEDRQWAVVSPGYCVVAKLYPYPFWDFQKAGTYGNARVVRVFDCPGKKPIERAQPETPQGETPAEKHD